MAEISIGIVGAGFMAQLAHIRCFQRAAGASVEALVSSRPEHLDRVADRFGIARRYQDHHQLCEDDRIDLAVVVVPPEMNVPICRDLLQAGKHVFCEKPVALAAEHARELVDTAADNDRQVMVGFMKRFDGGVQRAKGITDQWLESGEAGDLLFARVHAFSGGDWTGNIKDLFEVQRSDEPMSEKETTPMPEWLSEEYGGHWGPYYHFNHPHSHHMDLLNFFLGSDFEVLYADWGHAAKLVTVEYGDALANIEASQCREDNLWDEQVAFYFEGGSVHIKIPPPLLINVPGEAYVRGMGEVERQCSPDPKYTWSFCNQAQNIVDVVAGKAEPICTGEDGVAQLEMIEAIFRHLQGG